jgi:iron complex transport system ATP-binding protein
MPIRAEHLAFAYAPDRPVLRDVSFALAPGTMTAILGPNGAGKSTLLRLALNLLTPSSGQIFLDDRPLRDFSRHDLASRIAYVPQRPEIAFAYSVAAVVAMGRYLQDRGVTPARVRSALDRMDIADRADDPFATLSAGQQQRVAIARALAQLDAAHSSPRLLLADEPVSAMDPRHALHAMRVLRELRQDHIAVAVVLHDLTLAARFCDSAILLSDEGRVVRAGPISHVLASDTLLAAFHLDFVAVPDPASSSTSNLWLPRPDRI